MIPCGTLGEKIHTQIEAVTPLQTFTAYSTDHQCKINDRSGIVRLKMLTLKKYFSDWSKAVTKVKFLLHFLGTELEANA